MKVANIKKTNLPNKLKRLKQAKINVSRVNEGERRQLQNLKCTYLFGDMLLCQQQSK